MKAEERRMQDEVRSAFHLFCKAPKAPEKQAGGAHKRRGKLDAWVERMKAEG